MDKNRKRQVHAAYKHTTIRTFKVGPFQFKNHILRLHSQEEEERFLKAFDGLLPYDQLRIKKLLNVENEIPVQRRGPTSIRGLADTRALKEPLAQNVIAEIPAEDSTAPTVPTAPTAPTVPVSDLPSDEESAESVSAEPAPPVPPVPPQAQQAASLMGLKLMPKAPEATAVAGTEPQPSE